MRDRSFPSFIRAFAALLCLMICAVVFTSCSNEDDTLVLRISNWEEYIDMGDWDEDELIELSDGTQIIGEENMIDEFEEWYEEEYGRPIRVEYSTFGTNEDLYNQLTLGDVYDLICPSEYMIMKLMHEDRLVPYDTSFFNPDRAENYYAAGVSPYIKSIYDSLSIEGKSLGDYTAGFMWGTLGIVYNPELVKEEDAAHWDILLNSDYYRQVTIKDSIRDAYFAALAIAYYDELTDEGLRASDRRHERMTTILNRTDMRTVERAQDILSSAAANVYSFETDAGKADMVTGKVAANQQWSGDAVYVMEQAQEDDLMLRYSVPEEGTNMWFDGWVMLKAGVGDDPAKKEAAQAFVNYISRPENVVRNMYYIGYTSVISGGESDIIRDYASYCYEPEDEEEEGSGDEEEEGSGDEEEEGSGDEEEAGEESAAEEGAGEEAGDEAVGEDGTGEETGDEAGAEDEPAAEDPAEEESEGYCIAYFFGAPEGDERYTFYPEPGSCEEEMLRARYPDLEVMDRAAVMEYFDEAESERINRMWINTRCFDLNALWRNSEN